MPDSKLMEILIKTLRYEYKTYSEILELAEKKTDILIKNDTAALSAVTEQENLMAEQTSRLNQVREQILTKLCQELEEDYKTFSIAKLIDKTSGPYKKYVEDVQAKLCSTVSRLQARNNINQKLIENAIKYINFNVQIIASPQPSVPLYGKSGQEVSHDAKRSVLDLRY